MRYLRLVVTGIFVVTLAAFSVLTVTYHRGTDKTPPVLQAETPELSVSVHDGPEALLQGLMATDDRDGDLTNQILVGKQSKFVKKGTTEVTFLVFDSSNNMASCQRTVTYTDYESPKFSLDRPLVYGEGDPVTVLDRLSAEDALQGNIDDKIKIVSSNVNKTKSGVYEMGVEVSNRYGDLVTAKLPINIVPTTRHVPQVELRTYLVNLKPGEELDPRAYLRGVELPDGGYGSLSDVEIVSNVNTQQEGVYQAVYSYTDDAGRTGCTSLTVIVTA